MLDAEKCTCQVSHERSGLEWTGEHWGDCCPTVDYEERCPHCNAPIGPGWLVTPFACQTHNPRVVNWASRSELCLTREREQKLVAALEEAQEHIIVALQPEFAQLASREIAPNDPNEHDLDPETYWSRLATWWHGVGAHDLIQESKKHA